MKERGRERGVIGSKREGVCEREREKGSLKRSECPYWGFHCIPENMVILFLFTSIPISVCIFA